MAACFLLAASYIPLGHIICVWSVNDHTTGEVAALGTIGSREDRRQAQPIMDLGKRDSPASA